MRSLALGAISVFVVLSLFGCGEGPRHVIAPEADDVTRQTGTLQAGTVPPARVRTYHDRLAEVARIQPAFAGSYFDGGLLHVAVTDARVAADVLDALQDEFPHLTVDQDELQIRTVDYGFLDLYRWRLRLADVLSWDHVWSTDINERMNRLVFGISDTLVVSELLERAEELNVPGNALRFEARGPIYVLSTLRDSHRPTFGGLRIARQSSTANCTLAVNGTREGVDFFGTAGHCTEDWGAVDGSVFEQDTIGSGRIGEQFMEAAFFTNSTDPNCPSGELCRYEDFSLQQYDEGVSFVRGIADVTFCGIGPGNQGSITLSSQEYRAVNSESAHPVNPVRKVGYRTGCTQGELSSLCENVKVSRVNDQQQLEVRYFLCVSGVEAMALPGDSGAPVYDALGSSWARIGGVVFAGDSYFYYASRWDMIQQVYGNLNVVN